MIKRFKNFDAGEFLKGKKALKEAVDPVDNEDKIMEKPELDPSVKVEDVITGKAVYDDKYLLKISRIVSKRLNSLNLGEFGIYHDIIYLNGVPGIWFFGVEDNTKNIVVCRDTNRKFISIFNNFELGGKNTAVVTYSTEKFGFKDMLEQMAEELSAPTKMNEELLLEAGGFGDGYSPKNIANFKKLNWYDKKYIYDLVASTKKGDAKLKMIALLKSGDKDVKRILSIFGSLTEGSCKYIVGLGCDIASNRYPGVNKDFDDLVSEYNSKYSGSGPAITVTTGDDFETADLEAEEEARLKAIAESEEARLKEQKEEYKDAVEGLREITEAMCNYVKQRGNLSDDDWSILSKRAVLLTGAGGTGKTQTVTNVLKEKGMIANKDYKWITLAETNSVALYKTLYEYNGKLIVFDDAPKLFEGEYRESLWKNALQTEIEQSIIYYPHKGDPNVYKADNDALRKDRQKRYYLEMGKKSEEERRAFFKKEMSKNNLEIDKVGRGSTSVAGIPGISKVRSTDGLTDAEVQALMNKIADNWKEEAANATPQMPNTFTFKGVVMIITNVDRERFVADVGPSSWKAIASRFKNYNINPPVEAFWAVIKDQILSEYNDKSITDDKLRAIPSDMTEEFIAEVERLIADPECDKLNWRTIKAFGKILRGAPGLKTWKRELKRMLIDG